MEPSKQMLLQFHVTAKCDQSCKHCYMHECSTYKSELENELSFSDCKKVIDEFANMTKAWGVSGRINFSGGNPLLRKDFLNIIKYANEKNLSIGILGNPYHLTVNLAKKLKDMGVIKYQLSIDGLEKTHDMFRKNGSFKDTIKAIRVLNKVGITSVVMFTLSRINANELLDVIELVSKENVSIFDFSRLVPLGSGEYLENDTLTPSEFRGVLFNVLEKYRQLTERGTKTYFGRKDPLWSLLYEEIGLNKPLQKTNVIHDGCSIGMRLLSILADGTVYACRRLPIKIGKVPEENLRDIFIKSKELNCMRDISKIKGCNNCELVNYCRGCRAVAYAQNKMHADKDPQCWKIN